MYCMCISLRQCHRHFILVQSYFTIQILLFSFYLFIKTSLYLYIYAVIYVFPSFHHYQFRYCCRQYRCRRHMLVFSALTLCDSHHPENCCQPKRISLQQFCLSNCRFVSFILCQLQQLAVEKKMKEHERRQKGIKMSKDEA